MHRTFSDPITSTRLQQHVPQRPSRLNPALSGRRGPAPPAAIHGRGTVSMPTSPLRRTVQLPWTEPHSAQAFFGYTDSNVSPQMDVDPFSLSSQPANPSPALTTMPTGYSTGQPDPFHLTASSVDPSSGFFRDVHDHDRDVDMMSVPHTPSDSEVRDQLQQQWVTAEYNSPTSAPKSEKDEEGCSFAGRDDGYGHGRHQGQDEGAEGNLELDGNDNSKSGTSVGQQGRRKRQQVRVACTHCQKACKKCSNTRPCERCTRYNLSDCVDSTRKPRKTGVKRGPYRRRNSNGQGHDFLSSLDDTHSLHRDVDSSSSPYSQHELELLRDLKEAHDASTESGYGEHRTSALPAELGYQRTDPAYDNRPSQSDPQEVLYAQQQRQVYQVQQLQLQERRLQQQRAQQRSVYPQHPPYPVSPQTAQQPRRPAYQQDRNGQQSYRSVIPPAPHPTWPRPQPLAQMKQSQLLPQHPQAPSLPAPRPSRLENALSAALSGLSAQPRWVDGQRVQEGAGTMMPHTPVVPFPLSLQRSGRGVDPFSRAVSPIKTFHFDLSRGGAAAASVSQHGNAEMANFFRQGSPSLARGQGQAILGQQGGLTLQPYDIRQTYRSPTCPNDGQTGQLIDTLPLHSPYSVAPLGDAAPSAVSDEMKQLPAQPQALGQQQAQGEANAWFSWNENSPTTIALKRVRKPSLRTLIVEGISRESSPVNSGGPGPSSGTWSPGLSMTQDGQGLANLGSMQGFSGGVVRDGTMSPTLFQGDMDEADDLDWGFGA